VGIATFKVGDILYDTRTKDIGILIERVGRGPDSELHSHDFYMWLWEVYWNHESHQYYSEEGLYNMVISERLVQLGKL
jgi:hypothetical protein